MLCVCFLNGGMEGKLSLMINIMIGIFGPFESNILNSNLCVNFGFFMLKYRLNCFGTVMELVKRFVKRFSFTILYLPVFLLCDKFSSHLN